MSARPDLTTEELISFVEAVRQEAADAIAGRTNRSWKEHDGRIVQELNAEVEKWEAVIERLRSERPVVTPEMIEAALRSTSGLNDLHHGITQSQMRAALEAALSVSSTKGKP